MKAIFKRELRSYFSSPVGYVCVAAIAAFYGFFYFSYVMMYGRTAYISDVYAVLFQFCMMVIPIITMKSFSEDTKNKTDQALLTAPVGVTSIVLGKFFAAFSVFAIGTTLGLLPAVSLIFFSSPPWGIIFGNYIGTLLYGGAMVAIGIFISSLTQSQIIAAIGSFVVAIVLMFVDGVASSISNDIVSSVVGFISFNSRYNVFTGGIFSIPSTVFFISVMAIFVFITSRRVESRRWS